MTVQAEAGVMSFREHLLELRGRLVRVAAALVIGFIVAWAYRYELFALMSRPISDALADNGIYHFQAIQVTESVVVYIKTALIADLLVLSPYVFWQMWAFIAPGLYSHEKRFVLPLTAFSVVFFVIGATFSYSVLIPFVTDWLVKLTQEGGNVEMLVTMESAYGFAFTFILMFGLVFELPLVIFFMALWGSATGRGLLRFWRYFVLISFVIGAMLTPPDPVSQVMMAVPLNVLYGFGILVAYSVSRARERQDAHVGVTALKMMGLSLAGAIAVLLAVLLVVNSLPDRSLVGLVPQRAAWVVGGNPSAVWDDPPTRAILETTPGLEGLLPVLRDHDVAPEAVGDAVLYGDGDGLRAAMLRGDGLGEQAAAIHAALAEDRGADKRARDLVAAYADENTLIIGHRTMVVDTLEVAFGDATGHPRDEDAERLLSRVRASGPVWAWLPNPADAGAPWLGAEVADDVSVAGAVLSVDGEPRLSMHLRAKAEGRVALLDAALQRERDAALAVEANTDASALADAVRDLADELARYAPAEARARLDAIRATLAGLGTRATDAPQRRAIAAIAPNARGWSMTQNESWFALTTRLDDHALGAIVGFIAR